MTINVGFSVADVGFAKMDKIHGKMAINITGEPAGQPLYGIQKRTNTDSQNTIKHPMLNIPYFAFMAYLRSSKPSRLGGTPAPYLVQGFQPWLHNIAYM